MEEIELCFDCDEDVWFPMRPDGPKYKFKTNHVCCPERRRQAVEKWMKRDEVGKRWLPTCPNHMPIEVPSVTITE